MNLNNFPSDFIPVAGVFVQILITSLVISCTSPLSIIRFALFPVVAYLAWNIVITSVENIYYVSLLTLVAGNNATFLFRYVDLALLSRWSYPEDGPTGPAQIWVEARATNPIGKRYGGIVRSTSKRSRFMWGLGVTLSFRHSNSPFEVKNVPYFSTEDDAYVPSREKFLRNGVTYTLLAYALVDILGHAQDPARNSIDYAPKYIPIFSRISEVSALELARRTAASLGLWPIMCCLFRVGYGGMSLVAVGLGQSEVKDWRPQYGSAAETYTLRKFWGVFEHQMLRETFLSPACLITHSILRLTKGGFFARYTKMFFVFLMSGIFHILVDRTLGIPFRESGSVSFFCLQALGILLEDIVQAIYQRLGNRNKRTSQQWTRVVGYLWVIAFLIWTTPAWVYPQMARTKPGAKYDVLPSVFRQLV
ncbi:membrane bound O-acyl transferase family-domain-containing protein [Bisporella sp. PMI_857]|nr:membrane bound O-acyl transferase family-domain-containing protein [Bisporella sp. PMI_857]